MKNHETEVKSVKIPKVILARIGMICSDNPRMNLNRLANDGLELVIDIHEGRKIVINTDKESAIVRGVIEGLKGMVK